ncbi:MAG: VWA domain-containing protein [Planctomycetes bacterium]|nr:VWA domain-containing protein [Planctomycetota bacterium]
MDQSQRTPSTQEFERWYSALDASPVFSGEQGVMPQRPPVVARTATSAPLDALDTEGVGELSGIPTVAPIVAPVVTPMHAPIVEPISGPVTLNPIGGHDELRARDDRGLDIVASFEVPSAPCDDEPMVNLLVTIEPSGSSPLDAAAGPVAHVILALDVSASMNRTDKYPLLTEALAGMLYDLKRPGAPDVLLSVVLYAYGAETIFRDRPASQIDPREVLRDIDRSKLRFGRYTDMVGALQRAGRIAYDQVQRNKAMPVRVCILTDGRPQDMAGTMKIVQTLRKLPVDIDALAFGKDADVPAMQELVQGGRGGTVKQVRSDTIGEAFGRIAETAAHVITNRAMFEFELRQGVVGGSAFRYRPARHRYGDTAFDADGVFRTDLGTLEAGRRYSLFFQLRLPSDRGLETEVGRITVRLPGHGGAVPFESFVSIPRHHGHHAFAPDREVQAARDVLAALGAADPKDQLRALRTRRKMYEDERRDPALLDAIDRAIDELESHGNLDGLPRDTQAAILSHTCTVGGLRR